MMSVISVTSLVLLTALCCGCSDKSRRLGEKETLDYKRELLSENHESISREQQELFWLHPARTKGELDVAMQRFVDDAARRLEYDRARLEREREEAAERTELEDGVPRGTFSSDRGN